MKKRSVHIRDVSPQRTTIRDFTDELQHERGKIKKVYKTYLTPCEKLLSIDNVERYLKPGITKEMLQQHMMEQTHLAAAQEMQEAKRQLFREIKRRMVQ